jgi:uncharacterized protein YkwD
MAGAIVALAAGSAQAQTQRDIDALYSLAKRMAAIERASQDPIIVATETGDIQSLLNLYRSSPDAAQRDRAASAMLHIGGNGPARLIGAVATDFQRKLKKYRGSFQDQVAALVRIKRGGATPAEIAMLQAKVTDLVKDPGLTKDRIVKEADPAIKRLEEVLTIDRKSVFANSPQLIESRKELMELTLLAGKAAKQLATSERRLAEKVPSASELETELTESEELAVFMSTPMKPEHQEVMFENMHLAKQLDAEEAAGIQMLNLMRIRVGLQPVAIDPKLGEAARGHSKDMRTLGFFSHESPVSGKTTPWDRAKLAGTSASGENIFYGSPSHQSAIMAWWHSPGHFKNMMNGGFRRIGLGRVDGHWTQMFGS